LTCQAKILMLFLLLMLICLINACDQPNIGKVFKAEHVTDTGKAKPLNKVKTVKMKNKVAQAIGESIKPNVAGSFYPADRRELGQQLDSLFKNSKSKHLSGTWGLVAPHAALEFSGNVSASAYKQVWRKPLKTIVVIGFVHNPQNSDGTGKPQGIFTTMAPSFETPLGSLEVDLDEVQKLLDGYPFIKRQRNLFKGEHSLEMHFPMIQTALKGARIVPLIFGTNPTAEQALMLGNLLADRYALRSDCLVVVSTDMSHYFNYEKANQMDHLALKLVVDLKTEKLQQKCAEKEIEFCGSYPLLALMYAQRKLSGTSPQVIDYRNSGDTAGNKSRVVGYSAIAFSRPNNKNIKNIDKTKGILMEYTLSNEQKKGLLALAKTTVESYVKDRIKPEFKIDDPMLKENGATFVTLHIDNNLRGCIGHTEAYLPLWQCVRDMAVSAATQDPRFPAVTENELNKLSYEITVLTPMTKVDSVEEIEVGRDGLMMEKGFNRGLLLPQVPVEWGWDREQFLEHTAEKAGLSRNAWRDGSVNIYSFQGLVFNDEDIEQR